VVPPYQYPIYPMQQQQQQQLSQTGANNNSQPAATIAHSPTASGSLPPLNDIFNAAGGKESQQSGYGSITTSPQIYNAPIRRLPPSGRAPPPQQQQQQQQQQTIGRTNSSNDFKRMQKGPPKNHRRVHSESNPRMSRLYRNRSNTEERIPRRSLGSGHNRSRTLSSGNELIQRSPRHRRADSSSSYHSMGGGSYVTGSIADSSMVSMRSNIAKSSLFGGVDEEGRPLLYFPYEAIRLVMIPDPEKRGENSTKKSRGRQKRYTELSDEDTAEQENHLPLTIGYLYSDVPNNIEDYYEDYHRVSDYMEQGLTPQWESLDTHPLRKKKGQATEDLITGKEDVLPPSNYVVAVSDDIYKRMLSEIADAQGMPCGLFFCGHHEDVDYPSALIPTVLVLILFATLLYLSFLTGG